MSARSVAVRTPPIHLAVVGPLIAAAALGLATRWPSVAASPSLVRSFLGAAVTLTVAWLGCLAFRARPTSYRIELRPQHYLQAIAHTSIFVYWSFHWSPIVDAAPLIVAQIIFAYGCDMAISWARGETYQLGFGPFPIIFSTNLFLRFHNEWFGWQFVMVAVGFLAKSLLRWQRDGRHVHIFNPSSFPLALASLVLLATGTTEHTWGEGIATQLFLPPHIFLFIFLVALPGQYLFGVSVMTLPAVATTYLFSEIYFRVTGTYFFIDDHVPIAVFLGMHLLFTDPSTAPRSEGGRVIFGVLYAAGVVGLYVVLGRLGLPTFYDKLLPVPVMNLMVRAIDRVATRPWAQWIDPSRWLSQLEFSTRRLAYTGAWACAFVAMSLAGGIGDSHPGHHVPFWLDACAAGRPNACTVLTNIESRYCNEGSGWACNDLGVLTSTSPRPGQRDPREAYSRACGLGFLAGCLNAQRDPATPPIRVHPELIDLPVVLREGKGPLSARSNQSWLSTACTQGWTYACAQ